MKCSNCSNPIEDEAKSMVVKGRHKTVSTFHSTPEGCQEAEEARSKKMPFITNAKRQYIQY